jgi:hypothetical protein
LKIKEKPDMKKERIRSILVGQRIVDVEFNEHFGSGSKFGNTIPDDDSQVASLVLENGSRVTSYAMADDDSFLEIQEGRN